jgi:hypothetical protein
VADRVMNRALSREERDERVVPAKVSDPKARVAAIRRAAKIVKSTASIDFVRSVRGR